MRMYARGGEGPEVTYVEASAEDALDVADDQIDPLLDEGWRPEDVALLTTGARHPEQVALQESEGQDGYWRTFWDKDCVFYGHVLGCKGLERKVVVLCVNERMPRERSRERLYVGSVAGHRQAGRRRAGRRDPRDGRAGGGATAGDRVEHRWMSARRKGRAG